MPGLLKLLKKPSVALILLILVVLAIGIISAYSNKFVPSESMSSGEQGENVEGTEVKDEAVESNEAPQVTAPVNQSPSDLLPGPASGKNGWDVLDSVGTSAGANPDLLEAGHHSGIDTVGQSLRNANLQVRSDPQIPVADTGPWNQTTIEASNVQVPFNLGH